VSDSDSHYEVGDLVRTSCEFTQSGTAIDPDDVYVHVRSPDGQVSRLRYSVDVDVAKDSTGNYHYDVSATMPGWWYYYWKSTGNGQAAEGGKFKVNEVKAL
jgi:hypothetical protein